MESRAALLSAVGSSSAITKALGACLAFTYLVGALSPASVERLALVPDKVVPRVWTLLTAGLYEWNAGSLLFNLLALYHVGQRLERVWGAREYLRFLVLVDACVCSATFFAMYVLYVATFDNFYLFAQMGGFQGVVAGLLLALRQVAPEQQLPLVGSQLGLRNKHLVGLYLSLCLLLALSSGAEHHHIGLWLFTLFGAHSAWLYLRFFQPVSAACGGSATATAGAQGLCGDPREEFAFASLFPGPCQPAIQRLSAPLYRLFCVPPPLEQTSLAASLHAAAARSALPPGWEAQQPPPEQRLRELGARGLRMLQQRMGSGGVGAIGGGAALPLSTPSPAEAVAEAVKESVGVAGEGGLARVEEGEVGGTALAPRILPRPVSQTSFPVAEP